jgi:hypothetical protein
MFIAHAECMSDNAELPTLAERRIDNCRGHSIHSYFRRAKGYPAWDALCYMYHVYDDVHTRVLLEQ